MMVGNRDVVDRHLRNDVGVVGNYAAVETPLFLFVCFSFDRLGVYQRDFVSKLHRTLAHCCSGLCDFQNVSAKLERGLSSAKNKRPFATV